MTFLWILSKQTKQWKRSSLKRPDMGGQVEGINALGWETVLGDCMHEVQLRTLRSLWRCSMLFSCCCLLSGVVSRQLNVGWTVSLMYVKYCKMLQQRNNINM